MSEPDFLKRFQEYIALAQKDDLKKKYNADIEPFLREVANVLLQKYAAEKLYPHFSNFRTHISFRLGLDKKMTHRASAAVSFGDDYIESGFDLTHALGDAQ